MNEQVFGPINKAVNSANELGSLGVTAVWALFCMILVFYIAYMIKQNKASDKEWQDVRREEAKADASMAEAVNRLAERLSQLQMIILQQRLGGSDVIKLDQKA